MSFAPGPVRANHRFDEAALERYLRANVDGFDAPLGVQQFGGGQSNPTFLLTAGGKQYVLRKKPPGVLLKSAHQVDREFRIMKALAQTDVPVPRMHVLCNDESVIGTAFYVMDYLAGRIFRDPRGLSRCPRHAQWVVSGLGAAAARDYRAGRSDGPAEIAYTVPEGLSGRE